MSQTHKPQQPDDESPEEPQPQSGSKVYRTRTGELIGTTTEAVSTMARFTPTQAITVLLIVLVGFICITQTFQSWSDREERRSAAVERQTATATTLRENNAQVELTRSHCVQESASLRSYFAEQTDRRMRFEADERAKDRAAIASVIASLEELKKILKVKNEDDQDDPLPP